MKNNIALYFFLSSFFCLCAEDKVNKELFPSPCSNFESKSSAWNSELALLRKELQAAYDDLTSKYSHGVAESDLLPSFTQIQKIKKRMGDLHEQWKKEYATQEKRDGSHYSYWDQGETTLAQLVMEFGAIDYLYIMPHELSAMKIHLFSGIPIPHDSWEEMIEMILNQYGIGVKKVNSFIRLLFLQKHNPSQVDAIVETPEQLALLPNNALIFYVFSPPADQTRIVQSFFERFSDLTQTTIQTIGSKVILIATKDAIERLLNIYNVVLKENEEKMIRTFYLRRTQPKEAIAILETYFSELSSKARPSVYNLSKDELIFLPYQDNGIALIGKKNLVDQAEQILQKLEVQSSDPEEMTFLWYTCKHSDPEEIAKTLENLYSSISKVSIDSSLASLDRSSEPNKEQSKNTLPISPQFVEPSKIEKKSFSKKNHENFIVDAKTNAILMVVKRRDLEKIKELLKKLDVPKRMVRLDVLFVERTNHDEKNTGINLLKIGSSSKHKNRTGVDFEGSQGEKKGILDFMISHKGSGHIPSFDLTLGMLLAENNLQISARPSIIATNQTTATISIMDEVSVNNGVVTHKDAKENKTSFVRTQYGIQISMLPTIHVDEEGDGGKGFVSLQTKIQFDTPHKTSATDRPELCRRQIENEVRVADGETIILGGLLRKKNEDYRERLPFLGEIPGIGKLFGTSRLDDSSTQMFIFITPHIIKENEQGLKKEERELLKKRPGDTGIVSEKIREGQKEGQKKMFEKSMQLFWDSSK